MIKIKLRDKKKSQFVLAGSGGYVMYGWTKYVTNSHTLFQK